MCRRDRILAVQEEHQLGANVRGVRLPPTVDGLFWTQGKPAALAAHEFNDVPVMAGSNGDDLDASRKSIDHGHTSRCGVFEPRPKKCTVHSRPNFYGCSRYGMMPRWRPIAHEAARENGFLEDSRNCASLQAKYNRSPAYVEIFAHKHPYEPGVVIADQNPQTVGAYHTADVPYWFGTLDAFNSRRATRRWTSLDRSLSNDMSAALIAFAETGSPSTARMPWPQWTPKKPAFMVFGDTVTVELMHTQRMDWLAAHPAADVERGGYSRATRD